MMGSRPDIFMPVYVGDYLADTSHLSAAEHGAYLLLLFHYWRTASPLPDEDGTLARIARMTKAEWKAARTNIRAFFRAAIINGTPALTHTRVEKELVKAKARSDAGRKGAHNRWQTDALDDANAYADSMANGCDGIASQRSPSEPQSSQPNLSPPEPKSLEDSQLPRGKNGMGKNGASVTLPDPAERLARFQAHIARHLGSAGWDIVSKAIDPKHPEYVPSLALCKRAARELQKGWPRAWPN